jgi:hypothetical protein
MITVNLSTLFVIALVAGMGAYFGSYLREKGKNLATKEDVDRIVRKTEDIKAEITGDLWERQNRSMFKRDVYVRLLENLGIATMALDRLWDAETVFSGLESETRKKWLAGQRDKLSTALEEIHRTTGVAAVILNPDSVAALANLQNALAEVHESYFDYIDEQLAAVKDAYVRIREAAKTDLVLEARP